MKILDQKEYIEKLLQKFKMSNFNILSTPMDVNCVFVKPKTENSVSPDVPYQELRRNLMYLAMWTKPDIAYPVSILSHFNTNYTWEHWHAAKKYLRT